MRASTKICAATAGVAFGAVAYLQFASSSKTDSVQRVGQSSAVTSISASHLDLLPNNTLTDWVTFGDHVAIVKLTQSTALPASEEEKRNSEGYIPRKISFEVEKVVWSRKGAQPAPKNLDLSVDGWAFNKSRQIPVRDEGQATIEGIGSEYLAVLTKLERSESVSMPGWITLGSTTIVPLTAEHDSASAPDTLNEGEGLALKAVAGLTPDEVVSLLDGTPADPYALPYMDLPPDERSQAAIRAERKAKGIKIEGAPDEQ